MKGLPGTPSATPVQTRRLAIFVGDLEGRGAQRSSLNLLLGAHQKGIPCDLVLSAAKGELLGELPPQVRVFDLDAPRSLRTLPALLRYLRREKPWAMIAAEDHTNVVALFARRLSGFPKTITVSSHVQPSLWASGGSVLEKRYWLKQAVHLLYPFATARIAVASGLADEMADLFRLERRSLSVIPNPVVTPAFLKSSKGGPPHPWLEEDGTPVVLGVGSQTPIKGFSGLLEAFALLRGKMAARLILLGKGPEADTLEARAEALGIGADVSFPGFVPNPGLFFSHADLFVLSSRSEGFGNVLVEAMACGCPVVSTDCSSGPREILENGKHGPLVPIDNPPGMAEAMIKRLRSPRASGDLRAAAARFHVDRILAEYRTILQI